MKNLMSSSDFGKYIEEIVLRKEKPFEWYFNTRRKFDEFLKQPLELWMFRPCDEDGNVLEMPKHYDDWEDVVKSVDYDSSLEQWIYYCKQYQQAKERCLFEGLKWNVADWCDELVFEIEDGDEMYLRYNPEDNCFTDEFDIKYSTIEDLVKYKPLLTATAQKYLGL